MHRNATGATVDWLRVNCCDCRTVLGVILSETRQTATHVIHIFVCFDCSVRKFDAFFNTFDTVRREERSSLHSNWPGTAYLVEEVCLRLKDKGVRIAV